MYHVHKHVLSHLFKRSVQFWISCFYVGCDLLWTKESEYKVINCCLDSAHIGTEQMMHGLVQGSY